MTNLDGMNAGFRRADSTLDVALGVLSGCDAINRALAGLPRADVSDTALLERHLVSPDADEAVYFVLGLLAFERSFRALVERCAAGRPASVSASPGSPEPTRFERLAR